MSVERRYPLLKHPHDVADLRDVDLTAVTDGYTLIYQGSTQKWKASPSALTNSFSTFIRGATWIGGGSAIAPPTTDVAIYVTEDCTIQSVVLLAQGGPGNCQIDVWKSTVAGYPTTAAASICGGNKPRIVSDDNYTDTTLTGWTTTLGAGDVLTFHVESSTLLTDISLFMKLRPVSSSGADGYTDLRVQQVVGAFATNTTGLTWTYDTVLAQLRLAVAATGVSYSNATSGLSATTVQGAIDAIAASSGGATSTGTFTATLSGVIGSVTCTCNYTKIGSIVILQFPQFTGTSNTTSCGVTGLPVALRPTKLQRPTVAGLFNNSAQVGQGFTLARLETTGDLNFTTDNASTVSFTAAGLKGLNLDGTTIIYTRD